MSLTFDAYKTTIIQTTPCFSCNESSVIEVSVNQSERLMNGDSVQDIFPDASPDFRELLISGIHPECWAKMFSDE